MDFRKANLQAVSIKILTLQSQQSIAEGKDNRFCLFCICK